jgi:hypothetical protein
MAGSTALAAHFWGPVDPTELPIMADPSELG